jgi:hypothetical protein
MIRVAKGVRPIELDALRWNLGNFLAGWAKISLRVWKSGRNEPYS